jgi:hypothetical protein
MHDYMSVLVLLHADAAEQRSGALLCHRAVITNKTTERTLRNRARFICERMLELPSAERDQFAERAVRHL